MRSAGDRASSSCGADSKTGCSSDKVYNASDSTFYGDPAVPDGPERFRDAARHIVDLFDEVGATNLTYVVMPNDSAACAEVRISSSDHSEGRITGRSRGTRCSGTRWMRR